MTNLLKIAILTLFISLFFGGCVSSYQFAFKDPSLQLKDESLKALSQRDLSYWEHMSQKEFDASYDYELPYLRYLKSLEWYKNFNATNNQKFTIKQYDITLVDSHRAIIKHYYHGSDGHSLNLEDRWVLVQNEWFHYFELSKLPIDTHPF
jgi:hypothetical protein